MALFGRTPASRGGNRAIVEFKAGKMTMEGTTVKADPRKGTIYLTKGDDDLLHMYWKERQGQTPEDDLVIMANDVEFRKIPQCTTGRVFLVKFKGSSRRHFYWMQEPDASKDEETWKKLSDYFAGKPIPRTPASGGADANIGLPAGLGHALGFDDGALHELLQNVDRNQLLSMLGMGGGGSSGGGESALQNLRGHGTSSPPVPSSPRPTAGAEGGGAPASQGGRVSGRTGHAGRAAKPPAPRIQLDALRSILDSVQSSSTEEGARSPSQPPIDLSAALNSQVLLPILSDPAFIARLTPHLPQDPAIPQTGQEVLATTQSPQFKQSVQSFISAFETRQLGPLIQEFGLGPDAVTAANNGDFGAFIAALEKKKQSESASSQGSTGAPSAKKDKDDDEMSVD